MVSPEEGPSGTQATITVSGAQPGDPITLTIGQGVTTGIADANGNATFTHTFFGRPDEVIPITAQAGPSADSPTASTQFTIKAATPTDVAVGGSGVVYSGPTVSIGTALGSNLDNVERIWTFDAATQQWQLVWPLSPLPPNLSTQPLPEFVDGQIYWFVSHTPFRWRFPVAAGAGNAAALTVTVSPNSGPTGTTATITIEGAEPGAPITLQIGQGSTNLTADANGRASTTHTFNGQAGDIVPIDATAGFGGNDRTGSAQFTITALPQDGEQVGGVVGGGAAGLAVTITPSEGPSGTVATIRVTGVRPGGLVALRELPSVNLGEVADENGVIEIQDTFRGEPGDTIEIQAIEWLLPTGEIEVRATFTITGREGAQLYRGSNPYGYAGVTAPVADVLGADALAYVTRIWYLDPIASWLLWAPGRDDALQGFTSFISGGVYWLTSTLHFFWLPQAVQAGAGAAQMLTVTVTPGSGPSATTGEISVEGADPFQAIDIDVAGTPRHFLTADRNGRASASEQFAGQPGDEIAIKATAGAKMATTKFTITGTAAEPVTEIEERALTVAIVPSSGVVGTTGDIIITGALPGDPIVIRVLRGGEVLSTDARTADADGRVLALFTADGEPGDVFNFEVTAGPTGDQQTAFATFTITEPPPFGVSVSPDSGPNGTMATITVVGAEPGATVTLDIVTGDTLMAVANAAGTATFNFQFFGEIDEVLTMTATQADPAATADTAFTVTG